MYVLQTMSWDRKAPGNETRLSCAALMEWVLAAMVAAYVLALCIDLGPSSRAYFQQVREAEGYIEVVVPKYIPHTAGHHAAIANDAIEQEKEIRIDQSSPQLSDHPHGRR